MDYYGLLFLYYLKGLSGKSILRLFFNIEAGGTEQLLPENISTPTTTPILADIQYPDGLRTDQYFTYRETPTTVSNKARIKTIKGNTLVWNQLLQSLAPTTTRSGVTFTKNNDGTWTLNGTATANIDFRFDQTNTLISNPRTYYANHKYLLKVNKVDGVRLSIMQQTTWAEPLSTSRNTDAYDIQTLSQTYENCFAYFFVTSGTSFNNVVIKPQLFDLTKMGLDITDPSEFTSLFPLSYYSYNQGSLLSFNGNGIKTVGKNQSQLVSMSTISGGYINASSGDIATVKKGITYTLSFDNLTSSTSNIVARIQANGTWIRQGENNLVANSRWALTFTATDDGVIGLSASLGSQYSQVKVFDNIQLEFGSTASDYEPYTSSTLSLPISTYFPNGMKSAGTVYDELLPNKAITRIGSIDLGSITYTRAESQTSGVYFFIGQFNSIPNIKVKSNYVVWNIKTAMYETVATVNILLGTAQNKTIGGHDGKTVRIRDDSFTDATAFKNSLSGQYLVYELATPTETPITTEDANEALSLLMGKSVSSNNANQMIDIITKGE